MSEAPVRLRDKAEADRWLAGKPVTGMGGVVIGHIISTHEDERGWYALCEIYPVSNDEVDADAFG